MQMDMMGAINHAALFFRKHSPQILVLGGVIGTVAGGIMACKATTRLPQVREKAQEKINTVRTKKELAMVDEKTHRRGMARVYLETGMAYARLYGPACVVGGLSITSILAGNNMLRKRNVALAAAYATLDTSFKEYRDRVTKRFGEQIEQEIRYDVQEKELEETVTDEHGNTTQVKKTVLVAGSTGEYARYFEQGASKAWEPSNEYNRFFLTLQQRLANEQLRKDGYLFLNDVYEMLGFDRTKAGQIVGWVYDPKNADRYLNDNHVDFRIQEIRRVDAYDPDGFVETIRIDPNVDGPILEHASDNRLI